MYCTECGNRIMPGDRFCSECGTPVDAFIASEAVDTEDCSCHPQSNSTDMVSGVILTHIPRLAVALKCNESQIEAMLSSYVSASSGLGIHYKVLDLYDKGIENNRWTDIVSVLDTTVKTNVPQMLFIIGGTDVVEMPCIPHPMKDQAPEGEDDIETDILYAFGQGGDESTFESLDEMICRNRRFYVGRLPIGKGVALADVQKYFQRSANRTSFTVTASYAQCDPHWKETTSHVVNPLFERSLFPQYSNQLPDYIYYRNIFLTPSITEENVAQVFNKDAGIFFFNMHGSSAEHLSGFFGESMQGEFYCGIKPQTLTQAKKTNMVVTEACYGARHTGYSLQESMLLSALYAKTLTYFGSSRVAYGAYDEIFTPDAPHKSADLVTNVFSEAMLSGYKAGEALHCAQYAILKALQSGNGNHSLFDFVTLFEFNLFGDPAITVFGAHRSKPLGSEFDCIGKQILAERGCLSKISLEVVSKKKNSGVLALVRREVDRNIETIKERLSTQLYEQWGIEPRGFRSAARVTDANGEKTMIYSFYLNEKKPEDNTFVSSAEVIADVEGNIMTIYVTK